MDIPITTSTHLEPLQKDHTGNKLLFIVKGFVCLIPCVIFQSNLSSRVLTL